jgi:type IV secretory pathway VirD2 relaxase
MSDFRTVKGFEDVWRPLVGRRRPENVLEAPVSSEESRAKLARIAGHTPEVMIKVSGKTRSTAGLARHLSYITRGGALELETPDGWPLLGREEVRDLAAHWGGMAVTDGRRRKNTPFSLSIVLSMPEGHDPVLVQDAARAFAREAFGGRFDYVFALHTDEPHPHVHLSVRWLGITGERLRPTLVDLEAWRQGFARQLRERGVEAEATPRRARGVTLKGERIVIRKIREKAEAGLGPQGRVQSAAIRAAAHVAFGPKVEPTIWERRLLGRQRRTRALYLGQARLLQLSEDAEDRELGKAVEVFVNQMPASDTQRLALARALRDANERLVAERERLGESRRRLSRER